MSGGRVVKAPLGAGLRVTAGEGRRIDGCDHWPVCRSVADEHLTEVIFVDLPVGECFVEAAVAATKDRFEAEWQRTDWSWRERDVVSEFEQCVAPACQTVIELSTEVHQFSSACVGATLVSKTIQRSSPTTRRSRTALLTDCSHLVYCLHECCILVKVACQGHTLQEFP